MEKLSFVILFLASSSISFAEEIVQPETLAQLVCRNVDNVHSADRNNPNPLPGVVILDQIPTLQLIGSKELYISGEDFFDPEQQNHKDVIYESSFQFRYFETTIKNFSDQAVDTVLKSNPEIYEVGLMQKMTSHFTFSTDSNNIEVTNSDLSGKHEEADVTISKKQRSASGGYKCRIRQVANPYKDQSAQPDFEEAPSDI